VDEKEPAALPFWKAFVVQFRRETKAGNGTFAGRVEHMSTGRRACFRSPDELVAALREQLAQLGEKAT